MRERAEFLNNCGKTLCTKKNEQERPQRCNDFKRLVLSALKNTDWIVNDVQFDDDNVESINIKFTSEFSLGNSPWDPRDPS
jgi:hypothetical protein